MSVELLVGDCRQSMAAMAANSVDSVVTDPPYHLASIVKRFGAEGAAPAQAGATGVYERSSRGFMGKVWDGGDIAFDPATWAAALRVLKPGGHMVAFGAPKNAHRLTCAIEDAGFEIRDCVMWLFGTGFPKSHNVGNGWGTALKPAYEPIILARKPLVGTVAANVLAWGTGAINVDGCRTEGRETAQTQGAYKGDTAVNIVAARSGGKEYPVSLGRWPANVIHDGSDEVISAFPEAPGQLADASTNPDGRKNQNVYGAMKRGSDAGKPRNDSGSAARFFYSAKASKSDRAGSKHPTVKPISLMRYLCRLVTPPGGTVLDPFAGSGTTGQAALDEGFSAVLCEREAEYVADIRRRLNLDIADWPDDLKALVA